MDRFPQFRVLGPLQVWLGPAPASIAGRRERSLLAGLLLTPGVPVEMDRLVAILWPAKPPRDTAHALRTHVMRLRQHIGRQLVATVPGAYAIEVDRESIDAHRFDRMVRLATEQLVTRHMEQAELLLADALGLWPNGAPWIDLAGSTVGDAERARLVEERLEVEERLAAVRLCLHRWPLDDIEKLAVERPLRERRWLLLMVALFAAGQQARALRSYASLRTRLRDEVGLDPDRRLQDMEHRILEQDPSLLDVDPLSLVFG